MKRSDAIKKLIRYVISPHEIISKDNYDSGVYYDRAEKLLSFIEQELGMLPPPYRDMPNSWFRDTGEFGYDCYEWEPEDAVIKLLEEEK